VTTRQEAGSATELERGLVLAVLPKSADAEQELGELRELARTAGVEPIAELVQQRSNPDPRTYVGKGKLDELKQAYERAKAEVLLVDDELEPAQQRALENALTARVVDRTQLILDIFAQHATSAEGKLQVELAQLEYNLPRMRGMWQHLERLGGGTGALGAGVGTRGPGESQLETDRRIARRKIALLRRRLKEVGKHRATRRKERAASGTPTVALAGYTNVGKSTLLNALTGAEVSVENRLFETLDPTTRGFEHDGKRYLVTDTVGFIRKLPTQLVEGFASTLEETLVADLVLHVVDASEADERLEEMIASVDAVLAEIGADDVPVELVLNKIDRVDPLGRRRLGNAFPGSLQISAVTGEGLPDLRARIAGGRPAAAALRGGRQAGRAVRARRADRRAPRHRGGRLHPRAAAASAHAPLRPVSGRRQLSLPRSGSEVIDLPVARLRDDAILPSQAYEGDAGLDLVACDRLELGPGERGVAGTGIAVAVPEGWAGLVLPRSGLAAKHGLTVVNSPGLIDSGYRGEVMVILLNTDRESSFVVEAGMRIAQLVLVEASGVRLVEQEELSETERGARGHGSSGLAARAT
jgi:GTPase